MSIRTRLVLIFVCIKVVPLVMVSWFAWYVITQLAHDLGGHSRKMMEESSALVGNVADLARSESIVALNDLSRNTIERLTTDTAWAVAQFLSDRDTDIRQASHLAVDRDTYFLFLSGRRRTILSDSGGWQMNEEKNAWRNNDSSVSTQPAVACRNEENQKNFHYRPPERHFQKREIPLFLEMTFVDLHGMEQLKVTTSDILQKKLVDVSKRENTYCRAETYFQHLKSLRPREIYVSEVIGPYVKGHLIGGPYSEVRAKEAGIAFEPEKSAYAGLENPKGIRFQGLVRWATPVLQHGKIAGYVTLALDHTHIMEFTDHIVPTNRRYIPTADAESGNYAFMWDYKGRNISHPRDYFIAGYDPETGKAQVPWLEQSLYPLWLAHHADMSEFERTVPWFEQQSNDKKPSLELLQEGNVGLDCRFLNFSPQCTGWFTLTEYGGSGSFLIFFSGLWKLTTAAAIPYYTGMYGESRRGFGFVTIGANIDEFNKPAMVMAEKIKSVRDSFGKELAQRDADNQQFIASSLHAAFKTMTFSTLAMIVLVILVALWLAETLTRKITRIVRGIQKFQAKNYDFRLQLIAKDEVGQLSAAFNQMADTIQGSIGELETARRVAERMNQQLELEIAERQMTEEELARHKVHLEEMVKARTSELEKMIDERERAEKELIQAEKMAALGQLIAGIAHEINTPMGAIKSSGCNIEDAMVKMQEDMPALQERLSSEEWRLFSALVRQSQKKTTVRTSREERQQVRLLSNEMAALEIRDNRQMAFFLVQLDVGEEWQRYLPLLRHQEAPFIFETAYGLYSIGSNTRNINQAVDRISKIIYALKSFIRQGDSREITETDVLEGVETVLTIYHNQIKQYTELVKHFEPVPHIMAHPDELNQVWTNLVHNALQAMDHGGTLTITIRPQGEGVVVIVADTGCGIPEENREKIFDAFFTTKKRGEGSGLGLDIVKKIIQKHGGSITFHSKVGEGTSFTVFLPVERKNA